MTDATKTKTEVVKEKLAELRHLGPEGGLVNVVLRHPELYLECGDVLPEHFTEPLYRHLWRKIQEANVNRDTKVRTVPTFAFILHEGDAELTRLADETYGGFRALVRDFDKLRCRPDQLGFFLDRVLTMARQRDLVIETQALADQMTKMADGKNPQLDQMIVTLERSSTDLLRRVAVRDRSGGAMMDVTGAEWVAQQETARVAMGNQEAIFRTGMDILDDYGIMQPGRVVLSIIEYKGGKSTWAVTFAAALGIGRRLAHAVDAVRNPHWGLNVGDEIPHTIGPSALSRVLPTYRVAMIDLEMSKERDVQPRLLSHLSGVPLRAIQSKDFLASTDQRARVAQAADWVREAGVQFWHRGHYDLAWIRNVARETVYRHGTQVLILDYLRAPTGMNKWDAHAFEAELADTMKALAEEHNLLVLTFAQFNREGQLSKRMFKGQSRPTAADLQGNIKIINFVDSVLIQDRHPDDPRARRLWVDVSRVAEGSDATGNFMRVEPNFAYAQMAITRLESPAADEGKGGGRRKGPSTAGGPTLAPVETWQPPPTGPEPPATDDPAVGQWTDFGEEAPPQLPLDLPPGTVEVPGGPDGIEDGPPEDFTSSPMF